MILQAFSSIPLAHSGHLLIDLSVFLGPLLMVAIWLTIAGWRDRRKERSERAGHLR